MARTLGGIAAVFMGAVALMGAQAPAPKAQAPAPKPGAKLETYSGCVKRMLGNNNFRLQNAVASKASSASSKSTAAYRLVVPKANEEDMFDYLNKKVEVTGTVGAPLPVNNAMDDVKHIAVTNMAQIKIISDTCQ